MDNWRVWGVVTTEKGMRLTFGAEPATISIFKGSKSFLHFGLGKALLTLHDKPKKAGNQNPSKKDLESLMCEDKKLSIPDSQEEQGSSTATHAESSVMEVEEMETGSAETSKPGPLLKSEEKDIPAGLGTFKAPALEASGRPTLIFSNKPNPPSNQEGRSANGSANTGRA